MRTRGLVWITGVALWLSVGAGSPALADCPGDCPVAGGGTPSVDCLAEYFGLAATTAAAVNTIECRDGDAACDHDGAVDGKCVFNVHVCVNQDDPNLSACSAKGVTSYRLKSATGNAELTSLQSKVTAILPTSEGRCSAEQTLTVPLLGPADKHLPGQLRIRATASGAAASDYDQVALVCTPPPRPLGVRHFSINPGTSPLQAILGGLALSPGKFQGYLDLRAGIPDEKGIAVIDVVGASEFVFADLRPLASNILCLKPHVPAMAAGIVACKGQLDLSYSATVNHVAGVVGENGFTEEDCTNLTGTLGHGHVEGPDEEHPGVCNGPTNVGGAGLGDSGHGAMALIPDSATGLNGLTFDLAFITPGRCRGNTAMACTSSANCGADDVCMLTCADAPAGQTVPLPFVSGPVHVGIQNADAQDGNDKVFDTKGQNFSCYNWTTENGPGKLVFGFPQLHGFSLGEGQPLSDLITAFVLSDK